MFDNQYYEQIDSVAMGSSLGPILADIFMSDFETFLIHLMEIYLYFINGMLTNECLPFLDVLVSRSADSVVSTSFYQKDTFSGLMMQYGSFVPFGHKKSLVNGLNHRARKICSSSDLFQSELTNIKTFTFIKLFSIIIC